MPSPLIVSVIDDDESVRDATARLVRLHGFTAYGFASAEEFLVSPRPGETACLITDINLPGMSGLELQEHLWAQGRNMPIIFITAFPQETSRQRALESGAAAYITKPFNSRLLMNCVEEALKAPGCSGQSR